jgi:hypothetical protein
VDSESGTPHCEGHGVSAAEVVEPMEQGVEDRPGVGGARVLIGRTAGGRLVRVIYVPDGEPGSIFVITAYELGRKSKAALRRRMRRRS